MVPGNPNRNLVDIGRYDALVSRDNSNIDYARLGDSIVADIARDCRDWLGFASAVMGGCRGLCRDAPVGVLAHTPGALRSLGLPDLPVCHTVAHIARELSDSPQNHRHGLPARTLARVPEYLSRPVAAFPAGEGKVAVVLDATDTRGYPLAAYLSVAVPIDARAGNGFRTGQYVNYLLSVYGRRSLPDELHAAMGEGSATIFDEVKAKSLLCRRRQRRKAA